jgi:hypothetical protein
MIFGEKIFTKLQLILQQCCLEDLIPLGWKNNDVCSRLSLEVGNPRALMKH